MKTGLYAVYDTKGSFYFPPFCAGNDELAIRSILTMVLEGKTNISRFPEDYQIFRLGEFDDQSSKILSNDQPQYIISVCVLVEEFQRRKINEKMLRERKKENGDNSNKVSGDAEGQIKMYGQEQDRTESQRQV